MAEALGAIASIISIAGAGAKLSILLFDFAGNIGSAGSEVRAIGTEISLFCSVLQQLERTLAKAKNRRYSISAIETTQKILDQCQFIFGEINGIVGRLQKQKPSSGEVAVDFKSRVRWLFKRAQVQQYRATLESCKITLHLMLTTLEFAERVSGRRQVPHNPLEPGAYVNYDSRMSTAETELEDEQEELMTHSLATAQKCAVDRLEKLEDEELEREDSDDPEVSPLEVQERSRLIESNPGAGMPLPSFPLTGGKRASVWLNELLSLDNAPSEHPHTAPSSDSRRFSQLPLLLWKWTDQGEHWTKLHEGAFPPGPSPEEHQLGPRSESQPEYQHGTSAGPPAQPEQHPVGHTQKLRESGGDEATAFSPLSPKTNGHFHWMPTVVNGVASATAPVMPDTSS